LTKDNEQLTIYPNPSSGIFTMLFSHPELVSGSQTIEIYNVLGEKVYSQFLIPNSSFVINLSQPNGIYFYRVLNNDGGVLGEGKMVIQK
jgi:Secretion system C-terminal sorting domain